MASASATPTPESTSTVSDDELIAQATAAALQAKEMFKQTKPNQKSSLLKPPFSFGGLNMDNNGKSLIESMTAGGGGAAGENKLDLPFGDVQQRKIIEKGLGHSINATTNVVPPFLSPASNGDKKDLFKNVNVNIKEKIESLFPQHSKQQHQEQDHVTEDVISRPSSVDGNSTTTIVHYNQNTSTALKSTSQQSTSKKKTDELTTTTTTAATTATTATAATKPLLSAAVWKRRSGYGKYSMNAWEKRRLDIVGSKVMYYKCTNDSSISAPAHHQQQDEDEDHDDIASNFSLVVSCGNLGDTPTSISHDTTTLLKVKSKSHNTDTHQYDTNLQSSSSIDLSSNVEPNIETPTAFNPTNISHDTTTANNNATTINIQNTVNTSSFQSSSSSSLPTTTSTLPKLSFLEQAKQNIAKSINELAIHNLNKTSETDDEDAPRGSMDLHREFVSVAAISDHEKSMTSISPTPFGLIIMSKKTEQKWKVCFETHGEQIAWLTVLTEIIVRNSVATYNQELIKNQIGGGVSGTDGIEGIINIMNINNTVGGTMNVRDSFRPAPQQKDGMWNIDEKYSYKNLLREQTESNINEINGDNDRTNVINNITDEDEEALDEDHVKSDDDNPNAPSLTVENVAISAEIPIVDELPLPLAKIVKRGGETGPRWIIKGHNLTFVYALMNISIIWIYISPTCWILFPVFLILANISMLLVTVESIGNDEGDNEIENKSFPLSNIKLVLQMIQGIKNHGDKKCEIESSTAVSLLVDDKEPEDRDNIHINNDDSDTDETKIVQHNLTKPIAGTTTKRISVPTESPFVNNHEFIAWSTHSLDDVQVRGHGYLKTKKKIPCPASLYDVANVEIFDSKIRVPEMATKVVLPKGHFDDKSGEKRWNSPDTFIVSLAVPTEEPSFARPAEDGYGLTVTIYYTMKTETRDVLKRITEPGYNPSNDNTEASIDVQKRILNGVRLWEEWCSKAPTDADWQARFKLVPNVLNPDEVGLPSWIGKYCGKPVLIKRKGKTGFLSTHGGLDAFEFDISLHPFPYLAKKAISYLKATLFKKALVSLSYVVEARSNEELPEILIGDPMKIYYPNPDLLIRSNNFFAGTAPKSIKLDD